LSTLADAGLILRAQTGNQVFYRANRDHPAYAELRDLLAKTTGVFHQLAEALTPLAKEFNLLCLRLFCARRRNAESDIDLWSLAQ